MNKNILLVVGLLLVLTLQNVSALGITPGRTTINFEPELQKNVQFSIINSEAKDMSVTLYVKGELKDRVILEEEEVLISSGEESKLINYEVILPTKFEKPGLHAAEIVALETTGKDEELDGAVIGSRVAVVTQVHVYVPYPGKYLEIDLDMVESDQPIAFFVPMINRGKLDIQNSKARMEIYSGDDLVDEIEVGEMKILSGERKEFSGIWGANVNPGKYRAKVIVNYDGEEVFVEKEFQVGEAKLEIEFITVEDFELGEIAKFNILVNNKWTEKIENVYVGMIVYDANGNVMADFKSPTYEISESSKAEMEAYWDTEGVEKGTYDGKVILSQADGQSEMNVKVKISDYDIEVIGLTGRVIVEGKARFDVNNLLITAVVVLVLVNLIWFLIVKRLKKKRKK